MNELRNKIFDTFTLQHPGYTILYLTEYGSKLYGTNSANSDTDIKGIFIPSRKALICKEDAEHWSINSNNTDQKNTSEDIDCQLFSIHKFFSLLAKGETGAIDILFSMFRKDTIIFEDNDFTCMLRMNYKLLLSKNLGAFKGYCLNQAKKYGIKGQRYDELEKFVYMLAITVTGLKGPISDSFEYFKEYIKGTNAKYITFTSMPDGSKRNGNKEAKEAEYLTVLGRHFLGTVTHEYLLEKLKEIVDTYGHRTKKAQEENYIDKKAISHALRIMIELEELLDDGKIIFPLADADLIKRIKYDDLSTDEYADLLDELNFKLDTIDTKIKESALPDKMDKSLVEEIFMYYFA